MGAPDGAFARVAADTNDAVIAERSDQPKCGGVVRCEVIAAGQDRSPLQVAAAVIGNALEWYDFIVFGFFAIIIARLFFPTENQYASLLLTTATFGVGFFMRPVGGILLGVYADRRETSAVVDYRA
jgi:hypothetical protein